MKNFYSIICLTILVAGTASAQVPTPTITTTPATACTAPCNGTATAVATTVVGMTFLWSTNPPQTTNTISGLCPGVYTCTVSLAPFGSTVGTGTVTCATAVNEISMDENISLFPNPAHQELNLQLNEAREGKTIINIRNILGTLVYQESLEGTLSTRIDISELPVGIYDLELLNGNRITRQKFIKE